MAWNSMTVILLNVSGLNVNAPVKRHKVAGWLENWTQCSAAFKKHIWNSWNKHRLKIKDWRKFLQANIPQKGQAGHTSIRWHRLNTEKGYRKQWRSFFNDKRIRTSGRTQNLKQICTWWGASKIHKITNRLEESS